MIRLNRLFFSLVATSLLFSVLAVTVRSQPVRLDPGNPHYLNWKGKALIVVTSAEHYGAVLNVDFDYAAYLDALVADGLNYTRIFTGSYVEPPGAFGIADNTLAPKPGRFLAPWKRSDIPGYANGGNKFDLDNWDPAYFARLKDFVTEAERRSIVVEVTLFCAVYGDAQWRIHPFNESNNINQTRLDSRLAVNTLANGRILGYQESLTRKIANELARSDNVIYEIQNEPWADSGITALILNPYLPASCVNQWQNKVDVANPASLDWQRRIAQVIVEEENKLGVRHLIAQNVSNYRYAVRDLAPGVSIVNFHYAYPEAVEWNQGLNLPTSYDESGFLPQGDFTYRRQAWNFMLAGGAIFNNLDYSFTVGHERGDLTQMRAPGWGGPALRKQLASLKRFMESLDFVHMHPDRSFLLAPGTTVQAMADPKSGGYAAYLCGEGPVVLSLRLTPGRYSVHWMNPATGETTGSGTIDSLNDHTAVQLSSPKFQEDIAVRILRTPGH